MRKVRRKSGSTGTFSRLAADVRNSLSRTTGMAVPALCVEREGQDPGHGRILARSQAPPLRRFLLIHGGVGGQQRLIRLAARGEIRVAGGEGDQGAVAALESQPLAHLVETKEDAVWLDAGR